MSVMKTTKKTEYITPEQETVVLYGEGNACIDASGEIEQGGGD